MGAEATFGDLAKLTDRELQVLMREVDQKDLVIALSQAGEELQTRFLSNMSERVAGIIREEMASLGAMQPGEAEAVQGRILQQVRQLADQGQVTWPPGRAPAKKAHRKRLEKIRKALARQVDKPLEALDGEALDELFAGIAEIARAEGILHLEPFAKETASPFLRDGLQLVIDGTEPALVLDILETWMKSLMHEHEVKYHKIIEGIMSVQSGDNPRIVAKKLAVIY